MSSLYLYLITTTDNRILITNQEITMRQESDLLPEKQIHSLWKQLKQAKKQLEIE